MWEKEEDFKQIKALENYNKFDKKWTFRTFKRMWKLGKLVQNSVENSHWKYR